MKLVINLKLKPDASQRRALQDTLERCNEACNWLAREAFTAQVFGQYPLHKLHYRALREQFALTAQVAVRCIAKVADAYKLKNCREAQRTFRKWAGQPYDDRIFRFVKGDAVNLWTLNGRQTIPFVCGDYQRKLLPLRKGEVDLLFVKGKWYASCVVDIDEPALMPPHGVLGVDLGIVNIATDSDGTSFCGAQVERIRAHYATRRRILQTVGTRAATRRLKQLSGKQRRFQTITNHTISKRIVAKAERSARAIALEDLKHIRQRVKATQSQRQRLHNWSFGQLQSFIGYKAKRAGVTVQTVNAAYTSQTCFVCGFADKANRPTQEQFRCQSCGHEAHADWNAARNISGRVVVTRPMFAHQCVLVQ